MNNSSQTQVWDKHASQWSRVGAPLKPSAMDHALMWSAIESSFSPPGQVSRIGVLGVTPELVGMAWPTSTELFAFDHSELMIRDVWRANPNVSSHVTLSNWQCLPLQSHTLDCLIGDNSLGALPSLSDYSLVFAELFRVLKTNGKLCLRCFIAPEHSESVALICKDVGAGRIKNFHALKFKLAMTLSKHPTYCVFVKDIHALFDAAFQNRLALSELTSWDLDVINTIDAYRGSETAYTFPTLAALKEVASPWFDIESISTPDYELGDRCPTITFCPNKKQMLK